MSQLFLLLLHIGMFLDYSSSGAIKKPVKMPQELAGPILVAVTKCQPETGVGPDTLLLIYDGRYRDDDQFKNFIFCSYNSVGFLRKDGRLDEDKAVKVFKNEPLVQDGIRRCAHEQGKNARESLFKFYKCFADTTPVTITL